jgi:hypothetical protein
MIIVRISEAHRTARFVGFGLEKTSRSFTEGEM